MVSKRDGGTGRETLCSLEGEEEERDVTGKSAQKRRFRMDARVAHTGGSLLDLQSMLVCRETIITINLMV